MTEVAPETNSAEPVRRERWNGRQSVTVVGEVVGRVSGLVRDALMISWKLMDFPTELGGIQVRLQRETALNHGIQTGLAGEGTDTQNQALK